MMNHQTVPPEHFDVTALENLIVALHPLDASIHGSGGILKLKQDESGELHAMSPLSYQEHASTIPKTISLLVYRVRVLYRSFYCQWNDLNPPVHIYVKVLAIGDRICAFYDNCGVFGFLKSGNLRYDGNFQDMIIYRDKFYAVDRDVVVVVVDPLSLSFSKCCEDGSVEVDWSTSDSFLVQKYNDYGAYIRVYKLDRVEGQWIQVETLGDQIFFVGDFECSFSILANDLPPGVCKKWNCVYFSDDYGVNSDDEDEVRRGLSTKYAFLFSLKGESIVHVADCQGAMDIFWNLKPSKRSSKRKASTQAMQGQPDSKKSRKPTRPEKSNYKIPFRKNFPYIPF